MVAVAHQHDHNPRPTAAIHAAVRAGWPGVCAHRTAAVDMLITERIQLGEDYAPPASKETANLAEMQAEPVYLELKDRHLQNLAQERERIEAAFEARRRAIGRVGLENVRQSRLRRLEEEHQARIEQLDAAVHIIPSLEPVVTVEVRAA